jgi:hypothetical protein
MEWRFADGHSERLPGLARELVRLKIDVIVAGSTLPTQAAVLTRREAGLFYPDALQAAYSSLTQSAQRKSRERRESIHYPRRRRDGVGAAIAPPESDAVRRSRALASDPKLRPVT